MGSVGVPELIVIFVVALVVFGPRKLPELGRTLGKALAEFRKASSEMRLAMEDEMRELERHAKEIEAQATATLEAPQAPVGADAIAPEQGMPATATTPESAAGSQENPPDGNSKPA